MGKVYINGREAVHQGCGGMAIAFPDVCLCPPGPPSGPVPVPLTNIVHAQDLAHGASSVLIEGNPVGHRESFFTISTGNEISRSTGGGITSHAVQGKAYFTSGSPDVFIAGQPAVRHGDQLTQNHLNNMSANTPPSIWMSSIHPDHLPIVPPKRSSRTLHEGKEWVEFRAEDRDGNLLPFRQYRLTTPSGTIIEGRTLTGGIVLVKGIAKGKCKLEWLDDPLCKKK
jgi:uncharacterized Zn-binding protein involved in type VI secretion